MKKVFMNLLAGATLLTAACNNASTESSDTADSSSTVSVTHISGNSTVKTNPQQVVLLDYGVLDTYDELGLQTAVKGLPLAGTPEYLKEFTAIEDIVDVGTLKEANLEKVNEVEPDLIIIGSRLTENYDEFTKVAPTINLSVDSENYLASFKANQRIIGELYGKQEEIEKELTAIDARIEAIQARAAESGKKALIVLTNEGRLSAYGKGSRFGIIHDVFGVAPADETIESSTHGQSVSNEFIKEVNPDILFVIDRGAAIKRESASLEQFANPLIEQTNAFKNDKIVFLNAEIWYLSGGGLKSIKMMLDEVESAIQ
ncbi:MAG: siderophore ABC transporter substrate-binding protein [Sphingobacterium sp.]